jgi:hypothetical protein
VSLAHQRGRGRPQRWRVRRVPSGVGQQDAGGAGHRPTLSSCTAAARAVRNVRLTGRLARNVIVQRVLAQLAAYASANAQAAYYSGKLSFDIAAGEASSAQADFNNVTSAQRAADAHLDAAIPYIGKL